MTQDDETLSGIKSFSVGLGDGTTPPRDRQPPPPYRVLIFGDFATRTEELQEITGKDLADLMELYAPALTVEADNLLGSLPARLSEDFTFQRPRDFKPEALKNGMSFRNTVKTALANGSSGLAEHGQRFDKLLEFAAQTSSNGSTAPSPGPGVRQAAPARPAPPAQDDESDGLDALFSMVDAPQRQADSPVTQDLAKQAVEAFLSQTSSGEPRRPQTTDNTNQPENTGIDELLERQSALFLKDIRLRQVAANWMSLRMLLSELPRETSIRLFLTQVDTGASQDTLTKALGEPDGALANAAFDVILAANSTGLHNRDTAILKELAILAADNATCLFANLNADFAGMAAEDIGQRDAPHQALDAPGFEQFSGLRQSPAASSLALFWNEGRIVSGSEAATSPGIPAGWFALLSVLSAQAADAWPGLTNGQRLTVDLLETEERQIGTQTIADSVEAHVSRDAASSLASAGINALCGQANRAEVYLASARTLSAARTDDPDGSVSKTLSLARLNTLLQVAFSRARPGSEKSEDAAADLQARLEDISDGLNRRVQFTVTPQIDEDSDDVLDIDADVSGPGAANSRFSFRIGI